MAGRGTHRLEWLSRAVFCRTLPATVAPAIMSLRPDARAEGARWNWNERMQGKDIGRSRLALVSAGGKDAAAAPAPAGDNSLSPFSTAVPDRYFETAALRDCHARVARAALDSDTVAVVEGERGCGKTTFVRMLQKRVGPSRDLCYIDVRIPQGERYVSDCLRRAFGVGEGVDAEILVAQLIERGRHGKGCLIVVDDADKLSVFALRLLFSIKRAVTQAGGQIGVVVAMSPFRLDSALALPSFAPYRAHSLTRVELPHFSAQETADYLRARIESAGLAGTISFDGAQVQRIHQASGGLPQHIKRVAGELLDGGKPKRYRSARRQQRLAHIRHTLIPVALVVVPVVFIGLLLQAIFQRPAGDAVVERLMTTAGIEAAGTAIPLAPPPPAATGAVDRAPEARTPPPDTAPAKPAAPAQAASSAPPVKPMAAAAAPVPLPPQRPAAQEPPRSAPPAPETMQQAAVHEPAPEPAREVLEPAIESQPIPETVSPVQAQAQPAAETAALDGNAWLRAQDPEFYTLQLAGSEERKDVEQFIDRYALPGKVVVVEILRNGKVWYMVLYNSYPTWGEARRELGTLPPQIHRNDPFARRFASVQSIAIAP
jgi:DamX protein